MTDADEKIKAEKDQQEKDIAKAMRLAKGDFSLHIGLIMRETGCSATEAKFRAWTEGKSGLDKRLSGK